MTFHDDSSTEWLALAACSKKGAAHPDTWFPPRDKDRYRTMADEAKTYCYGGNGRPACPVRERCLWQAVSTDEQHGIWGGMSHRERNAFVRKWQRNHKNDMTLREYIFQNKEKEHGSDY